MRAQNFNHQTNSKQIKASYAQKPETIRQNSQSNSSKQERFPLGTQETICTFFLSHVRKKSPDWLLQQFDNLFISQAEKVPAEIHHALYAIISLNQKDIFNSTIIRSCYILINNWSAARYYQHIQQLIQLFAQVPEVPKNQEILSPTQQRLRNWLKDFFHSKDYQELNLFVSKYTNREKSCWSNRYASYLLTAQYLDPNKPIEQREAAKLVAHQLKEQFKLDLAMYTAYTPQVAASIKRYQNPTVLGTEVLRLMQTILTKRGMFSYINFANIFRKQVEGIAYKKLKESFLKYLLFSLEKCELIELIEIYTSEHLDLLYQRYENQTWDSYLLLRTCNRTIEFLTTQTKGKPSKIFSLLVIQGKSLTLSILLLKIILVSKNSYIHLESCIGYLIQYYEDESESECQWLISFLEVLKITLTVYAENIRYNLVSVETEQPKEEAGDDFSSYRVFSQIKLEPSG
jgi:hypothetical protein